MSHLLGLNYTKLETPGSFLTIHEGAIAEQFVGQQYLATQLSYTRPEIFYWAREKAGSMAEVDYLGTVGSSIIPMEVKAGKTGKLKSLQWFMREKKSHLGVHFSVDLPQVELPLLHLPLYLSGQWQRICQNFKP